MRAINENRNENKPTAVLLKPDVLPYSINSEIMDCLNLLPTIEKIV